MPYATESDRAGATEMWVTESNLIYQSTYQMNEQVQTEM
jgi:hypothetical protein